MECERALTLCRWFLHTEGGCKASAVAIPEQVAAKPIGSTRLFQRVPCIDFAKTSTPKLQTQLKTQLKT